MNWHPIFVHFPIALLVTSFGLDLLALRRRSETLRQAGFYNLLVGAVGIVVAVITGSLVEDAAEQVSGAHDLVETHKGLGIVTMILYGLLILWRAALKNRWQQKATAYLLATAVGVALVLATGYYGGQLVYQYGIGMERAAR